MRTDLFQDKKCIHLRLDKEVHSHLRAKLFQHGLSMQQVFEEFAKQFVAEDKRAVKIVEDMILVKLSTPTRQPRQKRVGELDHETLYNLIGDNDELSDVD